MASNPSDIDTTTVGIIAFWNGIDQGGANSDNFDPEDITGMSQVNSYELYDNAVDVTDYQPSNATHRTFRARVKSDGWIVAWMNTDNVFATESDKSNTYGYWDMSASYYRKKAKSIDNNTLWNVVNNIRGAMSASMSISKSEVGYYYYPDENATNFTLMNLGDNDNDGATNATPEFSYTASTTLYHLSAFGSGNEQGSEGDEDYYVQFENTNIVNSNPNSYLNQEGAYDLIGNHNVQSGTTYQMSISVDIDTVAMGGVFGVWG